MSNKNINPILVSEQVRAARAMLGWSASELGERAGLSRRTIQSLENPNTSKEVRHSSVLAIRAVFEAAGIEFIGTPEDGPGVRIRAATPKP